MTSPTTKENKSVSQPLATKSSFSPYKIGVLITSAYVLRNSVVPFFIPGSDSAAAVASYFLLGVAFFCIAISPIRLSLSGIVFLLACLPGSYLSTAPNESMPKYGGWALLVLVVGPVLAGRRPAEIRNGAWRAVMVSTIIIGVASFVWWGLRLPVLGLGSFSGIMNHANTLGPLAGLGAVFAGSKAIRNNKHRQALWAVIAGACIFSCIASSARISILAASIAFCIVMFVERRRVAFKHIFVIGAAALLAVGALFSAADDQGFDENAPNLKDKGLSNSRELLWNARLSEFHEHPYFGMGVGLAEGELFEGVTIDDNGKMNVEPGSSYLAVLSMTGLVGAFGIGILLLRIGKDWIQFCHLVPKEKVAILMGAGAFMAIDGIAEGWILAVGSPICLIFWLWLGCITDSSFQVITQHQFRK